MKAKRPRIKRYNKVTIFPVEPKTGFSPFSDVPLIMFDTYKPVKVKQP